MDNDIVILLVAVKKDEIKNEINVREIDIIISNAKFITDNLSETFY